MNNMFIGAQVFDQNINSWQTTFTINRLVEIGIGLFPIRVALLTRCLVLRGHHY